MLLTQEKTPTFNGWEKKKSNWCNYGIIKQMSAGIITLNQHFMIVKAHLKSPEEVATNWLNKMSIHCWSKMCVSNRAPLILSTVLSVSADSLRCIRPSAAGSRDGPHSVDRAPVSENPPVYNKIIRLMDKCIRDNRKVWAQHKAGSWKQKRKCIWHIIITLLLTEHLWFAKRKSLQVEWKWDW